MISITITDARVEKSHDGWRVMHPANDAILAYCTTEDEAERVRYTLARLAELLPPIVEPIAVPGDEVQPGDQLVEWKLDTDPETAWRKCHGRPFVKYIEPSRGRDPDRRVAACTDKDHYTLTGYVFRVIRKVG